MRTMMTRAVVGLIVAFMMTVPSPAVSLSPIGSLKKEHFDRAKLVAFATAAVEIDRLVAIRQPEIDKAETEAKANALADAAVDEIAAIIENTRGIDLSEYRVISKAIARDPVLHRRVNDIAKQLKEGTPRSVLERPTS